MSSVDLEGVLSEHFGLTSFREGQLEIIETLLAGRDVVAVMPTGGGKSLCYQLPALVLPGLTLVISPLIALMKDQVDALTERGIPARALNSSLSAEEQAQVLDDARRGRFKLLYVAPERFRSRRFLALLDGLPVSLFAVDEAHCLSQWGHDFRPDYLRLGDAIAAAGRPTVAAFTATATPDVRADIATHLGLRDPRLFFSGIDRPNLFLAVRFAANRQDKLDTIARLHRKWKAGAGIVYASTRKNVDRVWAGLAAEGVKAVRYHAGLTDEERRDAQDRFMSGAVPLIVATNAFGMGVDKADIRFVAHFDFPGSLEAYYQEVGRAGRDGQPAECQLLFNYADLRIQEFFAQGSNPPRALIEAVYGLLMREEGDVIELTAAEITARLKGGDNEMAVATALKILDRYGALDRDATGGAAWVQALEPLETVAGRVARAPAQLAVVEALAEGWGPRLAAGVEVDLSRLARRAGLERDGAVRALGELHRAGLLEYVPPFRGRAIRVADGGGLERVDWDHLQEKAARDHQRVRDVVRFAYSELCRKAALRRYFGVDPGSTRGCGSCDICLGARPPRMPAPEPERGQDRPIEGEELEDVRRVLACIARMNGRYGKGRVADVLTGSRRQEVLAGGLDLLSTYGILKGRKRADVAALIDALLPARLARTRVLSDGPFSGNAVVELTPLGVEVMAGRRPLVAALPTLPRPEVEAPRAPGKVLGRGTGDWDEDGPGDGDLLTALKQWRRRQAEAEGAPPFHVFHDRVLNGIARFRPSSESELLAIKGVGPVKVSRYGEALLGLILEHQRLHPEA